MSVSPAKTPSGRRSKAVLYCQRCGHADHVVGEWIVREDGRHRRLSCPECGATVDVRPVDSDALRTCPAD